MIRVGWILLALTMPLRADPWRLVWSDEFSGQGPPDSSKWSTEMGFLRNEEKQYYTGDRPENVRQADGLLILECRREEFVTPDQGTVGFTSGSITTWDKASWRYGRFEIRAKMPRGKGTWASLWLMGVADLHGKPWPTCGEIDIAEHVGKEPENIYGTVHFQKDGRHRFKAYQTDEAAPQEDFHLYTVEWGPKEISFLLDGEEYGSFRVSRADEGGWNPFQEPFYLIITLALGGTWGGEIEETALPQKLQVDFVRIYAREDGEEEGVAWNIESSRSR
jgi:beta-glucanase (GH16 family)